MRMQRVCVPMAGFATETSVELLTQYLNFTALLLKEGFTFERFETYGFVYVREMPVEAEVGRGWSKEYLGVRGGQQAHLDEDLQAATSTFSGRTSRALCVRSPPLSPRTRLSLPLPDRSWTCEQLLITVHSDRTIYSNRLVISGWGWSGALSLPLSQGRRCLQASGCASAHGVRPLTGTCRPLESTFTISTMRSGSSRRKAP